MNTSILNRYVFKEVLSFFTICLIAFTGVLLTVRILKFANLIINKGVEVSQIGMVFTALLPTFLEIAIPMAMLLGVMLAFARFSGDSELIVIRASGISLLKTVKAVAFFGVLGTIFSLYVSISLRPWGFQTLSKTLFEIARSKSISGLSAGVFNELGKLTLYTDTINYSTGELNKVLIDDKRKDGTRSIITAKDGAILSNPKNRTITILLRNGQIHEKAGTKYSLTNFNTNSLVMNPADLFNPKAKQKDRDSDELYMGEIHEKVKFIEEQISIKELPRPLDKISAELEHGPYQGDSTEKLKQKINELFVEKGRRFSMPFATLALALLGMPLGVQPPRTQKTWGAGLSMTVGLVIFVLYYGFLSIGIALAENGAIPTFVALWLPNFLVFAAAAYSIKKIATEEWQSVADPLDIWLQKLEPLRIKLVETFNKMRGTA